MIAFFILLLIIKTSVSNIIADPVLDCSKIGCVFNETNYEEGSVIECKCIQFTCKEKKWVEIGINNECCTFNGEYYENGFVFTWGCFLMKCKSGSWSWNRTSVNCKHCLVSTDPNIYTFDGRQYRFNGICNYTLSQPINCKKGCDNYLPPYAVYGQFSSCTDKEGVASCVDITTYKVDPNTAVEIDHSDSTKITINGNPIDLTSSPIIPTDPNGYEYPVFAWQDGCGSYVIGLQYSVIACGRSLTIYTPKETSLNKVSGLCGFYSENINDDFQARDCTTPNSLLNVLQFATSWMTLESDLNCLCSGKSPLAKQVTADCKEKYTKVCEDTIYAAFKKCGFPNEDVIKFIIESCVSDSCQEPESVDFWVEEAGNFACVVGHLASMQNSTIRY